MTQEEKRGDIIIYERKDGAHFDVSLHNETVWLTQAQIGNLFVVKKAAISKHIKHIYEEGELVRKTTVSKMETVQREGNRTITRTVEYYNLDMIISIGYRVHSRHATQFRLWASQILKAHILKGYTVNIQRLKENHELEKKELEKTIGLLQKIIRSKELA